MIRLKEATDAIRKESDIQKEITRLFRLTVEAMHEYYCGDGCNALCWQYAHDDFTADGLMEDELPTLALERARVILAEADAANDWKDCQDTIDSVRPGGM